MKYIYLMRPKHYMKNLLIFLPILFGGQLGNAAKLQTAIWGFCTFCIAASIIYILNDIQDRDRDKYHPTKKNRPIASGSITLKNAYIFIIILICIMIILQALTDLTSLYVISILAAYIIINMGYSFGLKNYALLDVSLLASGFLIRVLYGAAITDIAISHWLYLTVLVMSFYLGLGKRRNELLQQRQDKTRQVLKYYTSNFLDKNMYMCVALTIIFYSLWCVDSPTNQSGYSHYLIWTVPLIILVCMRYSLIIEGNSNGDPVDVVLGDKILLLLIFLMGIIVIALVYL